MEGVCVCVSACMNHLLPAIPTSWCPAIVATCRAVRAPYPTCWMSAPPWRRAVTSSALSFVSIANQKHHHICTFVHLNRIDPWPTRTCVFIKPWLMYATMWTSQVHTSLHSYRITSTLTLMLLDYYLETILQKGQLFIIWVFESNVYLLIFKTPSLKQ